MMYLRVTIPADDYDPNDDIGGQHEVTVRRLDHVGLVELYTPCTAYEYDADKGARIWFDGGKSSIEEPDWNSFGFVDEIPPPVPPILRDFGGKPIPAALQRDGAAHAILRAFMETRHGSEDALLLTDNLAIKLAPYVKAAQS